MENIRQIPSLADLVTILYQPRETMRRILDSGGDRWTLQIAFLAAVCSSISDANLQGIQEQFPSLPEWVGLALAALIMIAAGMIWVGMLFLISWIVALAGKFIGGTGTVADVRAALAWSLVPAIWAVTYQIPIAIYKSHFRGTPHSDPKALILEMLAHGGCAVAVTALMLQLVFFVWFLFIASNALAEAQRFSPWKGLGNLAIVLALPVVIACAAVIAFQIT